MKLIVGLGNIGKEYEQTRHNIGFMLVDALAANQGCSFQAEQKFLGEVACFMEQGEKILLLKPSTYMNESGRAVKAVQDYYQLPTENILIIQDDLDLALGRLRFRLGGSAGGHNGIKSIIQHLHTDQFKRLRLGIGRPQDGNIVHYVLSRFTKTERVTLEEAFVLAQQALTLWSRSGDFSAVMNQYNRKK